MDSQEPYSERSEPSESYVNNFFLDATDDADGSSILTSLLVFHFDFFIYVDNQGKGKVRQSYDNYDY